MSDSWNPYEVAPMARAASAPRRERDVIDDLDVSATWKRRFRLIEKAGGVQMKQFRDLSFGERLSIGFSALGFFFGPIYYLCKGLWRPAIAYFLILFGIALVAAMANLEFMVRATGYAGGALYGARATLLYYRKQVLGETPWL